MSKNLYILKKLKADKLAAIKYDPSKTGYTDKTANGLTKCIIDFLKLNGWQAERINTTGRFIRDRSHFKGGYYIPTAGQKGSADISATIKGKSVKIEVKMKDRQSKAQKDYQESIERAGGIYIISRSFDDFYEWYIHFI